MMIIMLIIKMMIALDQGQIFVKTCIVSNVIKTPIYIPVQSHYKPNLDLKRAMTLICKIII